MQLHESVESILDAAVAAVEFETNGGTLAEVSSVVRGSSARPMPELPAAWIVPGIAQMNAATYGEETWELLFSVAVVVKSDDPVEGAMTTQRLTALARSALLRLYDHSGVGNMIEGADVTDVVSVSFDPAARSSERNRTLFWTEAVLRVTFTVTE